MAYDICVESEPDVCWLGAAAVGGRCDVSVICAELERDRASIDTYRCTIIASFLLSSPAEKYFAGSLVPTT